MGPSTSTTSLYGARTLVAVSTGLRARVVGATIRRRDMRGTVEERADMMWLATTIAVTTAYGVKVGGLVRPVREIEAYGDTSGQHHLRVTLGWGN